MNDDLFSAPDIEVAVHNVEATADLLDEACVADEMDPLPWEDAALLLKRLRAARQHLAVLESAFERHIASQWKSQGLRHTQEVVGVGAVEVHSTRPRKGWQHADVMSAVLDAHLAGTSGEFPAPWEVRDWIMDAAHVDYWRTGALRGLGIDPDDYSTPAAEGHPTVRIG